MAVMKEMKMCGAASIWAQTIFLSFCMRGGFWMFLFSEVSINSTVGTISLLPSAGAERR
jgi:hypothetical protein